MTTIKQQYERTIEDIIEVRNQFVRPQAKRRVSDMFKGMGMNQEDFAWLTLTRDRRVEVEAEDGVLRLSVPDDYQANPAVAADDACKLLRNCALGSPYYVTRAMTRRLEDWLDEHRMTKTIPRHYLPTDTGFLRFEGGLRVIDYEQDFVHQDVLVWGPHPRDPSRLVTFWLIDTHNPTTVRTLMESNQRHGRWDLPEDFREVQETLSKFVGGRFLLDTYSFMSFESEVPFGPDANQQYATLVTCALFMLMHQPIAGITGIPSSTKLVRKQAKRKGIEDEINVIYLRKEVDRDPELRKLISLATGQKRRRHRVRSHWATYWVKDENGERVAIKKKRREHFRGSGETVFKDEFFVLKR